MSDQDYARRKFSRPSHDQETVGPIRFFKTVRDPYGEYPTDGMVYYARLLRDVRFAKEAGTAAPTYVETGFYDWIGALAAGQIAEGSVILCTKIGARWWTGSAPASSGGIGDGTGDGIHPDSRDCVYPGADLHADCPLCPCSADPWVIRPGLIQCGDATISGPFALFLIAGEDDTKCTWESFVFDVGERSFRWQLVLTAGDMVVAGDLNLIEESGGYEDPRIIETWHCDDFCCGCRNCFDLRCTDNQPVPCRVVPEKICLATPRYLPLPGISVASRDGYSGCSCFAGHCPEIPEGWVFHKPDGSPDYGDRCGTHVAGWDDFHCRYLALFIGDPDIFCEGGAFCRYTVECTEGGYEPMVVVSVTTGTADVEDMSIWQMPLADFDCDGENAFTDLVSGSGGLYHAGGITISPAVGLVDDGGNFVLDEHGDTIPPTDHDDCDPGGCIACFQAENIYGVYQWVPLGGPGDGPGVCLTPFADLIPLIPPPTDFFPDPGIGLEAGVVCFKFGNTITVVEP